MPSAPRAVFPPFHVDLESGQLFRNGEEIRLRPKTFAVLRHLLERAGRLVTRAELVTAVWHDAHGSDGLPKGCVRELRAALGDPTAAPRFVESVGRRGYRFVAPVTLDDGAARTVGAAGRHRELRVGRKAEIEWLLAALDRARAGERQMRFVTGEPGIGKTTVVEAFCRGVTDAAVARGQCVEQYGAGEPYLPVLEALGRLCHEPDGARVVAILDRCAPTWLAQLPALLGTAELERLRCRIEGASRERMLREMTDAVEALARERPVVLVLEDLHWSDRSTVDLLAALARRRDAARLLVVGTYRPTDLIVGAHPLRVVERDLAAHGQCDELPLGLLDAAEVSQYLAARFPVHDFPATIGDTVHRTTDGNPLFMVNVVDDLVARGAVAEVSGRWRFTGGVENGALGVPESLRQLIGTHVERLAEDERRVLEGASVVGGSFSPSAVADALGLDPERVEETCDGLVRRSTFLAVADSSDARERRYAFLHALYPLVLYDRLTPARRARLHQRIGEAEEALYGERAGEVAAQLAVHFERAHDAPRAIRHLGRAAENALRRCALGEAVAHVQHALGLMESLPETAERAAQELPLQVTLGGALMATEGYGARDVEHAYARARVLGRRLVDAPGLFPMLRGMHRFYLVRADIPTSRKLAERCRRIAVRSRDPVLLAEADVALGETTCYAGALRSSATHLARAIARLDATRPRATALRALPWNPRVGARYHHAIVLWLRGRPDEAARAMARAQVIAHESQNPFIVTYAFSCAAFIHHLRREPADTARAAEASEASARTHGYPIFAAVGSLFRGWVLATRGNPADGVAEMHHAVVALRATGSRVMDPYWLALVAEASVAAGRVEDARCLLAEARSAIAATGERWCEAEVERIEGNVVLAADGDAANPAMRRRAERCFRRALAVARQQGAVSFALRAATSLARLHAATRRAGEARALVRRVSRGVVGGLDTGDVRDARSVLSKHTDHPARARRARSSPHRGGAH